MAKILPDGSVIPSEFSVTKKLPNNNDHQFSNLALRVGKIINIYYPDNDRNISKKYIEYDVRCAQSNRGTGANFIIYRNCRLQNTFGSSNNFLTYTFKPNQAENNRLKKGSNVLFMCLDGIVSSGCIILGAYDNPEQTKKYSEEDGQFYDFNFNGINLNINKDGEFTIAFNSPTDDEGNLVNKEAQGTQIKIDKDGKVKISDNEDQSWEIDRVNKTSTWTNGKESITIDKANQTVSLNSSGELNTHSDKATSIDSGDAINLSSQKDLSVSSESNLSMKSSSNMSMNSSGNWQVQVSGNAQIQASGNLIMEGGAVAQMKGEINMIGEGSAPVGVVGTSISIGVGNLGAPVVSTLLTGSSTVLVGT
jgi:hypothetical protein